MCPSHPITQNFIPGHFVFIQSNAYITIVEHADCDVLPLSFVVVIFAYCNYNTMENQD